MLVDLQRQVCDLQVEFSDFPETFHDQSKSGLGIVMGKFFSCGSTFSQPNAGAVPPPSHHALPPSQQDSHQDHAVSILLDLNTTNTKHINTPALVMGSKL
jgi:hypothetical protein